MVALLKTKFQTTNKMKNSKNAEKELRISDVSKRYSKDFKFTE